MAFRKKPSEDHWIIARRIKDLIDAGDGDHTACAKVCAQLDSEGEYLIREDAVMIGEVLNQIIIKPAVENYWYNMIAGNCLLVGPRSDEGIIQSWLSKYWFIPAGFIGFVIIYRGKRK